MIISQFYLKQFYFVPLKDLCLFYAYECFACIYACARVYNAHRSEEGGMRHLELESKCWKMSLDLLEQQ